jgi:hypothetical protein
MITGTIMGEMKKTCKILLPGKVPRTRAIEAINPIISATKLLKTANPRLRRTGFIQSALAKN